MALLRSTENALQDIQIIQEGEGFPITVLATLGNAIQRVCKTGGREIAEAIKEKAKDKAPYKSGKLRDSIHVMQFGEKWGVQADATYAVYVEYGTSKMAARPFMRPAIAETVGYAKMQLSQTVWWDKQFAAARGQHYAIPLSSGNLIPTPAAAEYGKMSDKGRLFMGNVEAPNKNQFSGVFSGTMSWKK